ncbi:MAG: hypothetical protein D6723_01740 [Acidobacteria bacterium]|nr:MAG: hypothetical protein D6723_01740 [Acidobacteriota bacterium]
MSNGKRTIGCLMLCAAAVALGGPAASGGARAPVRVGRERHVIAGYEEPNTPPRGPASERLRAAITDPAAFVDGHLNLNRAIYVRFFDREREAPPRSIVIFIPGIVAGANSFEHLAAQLVQRSGGEIEVWAVDRRANLLEDARAMIAAEKAQTMTAALTALEAYENHPGGRGGVLANPPYELSQFMAEWGLDVHLRDLEAIVQQARNVGDTTRPQIFLGGYDFVGADLAALFAAYDFDGVPGFTLIDGLILLEGTPSVAASPRAPQIRSDDEYLHSGVVIGGTLHIPGLHSLRHPEESGEPPFLGGDLFGPFSFQLAEVLAQLALYAPHRASPLPVDLGPPVPSTNVATFALNTDDEFAEQAQQRFSLGFLIIPPGRRVADVAESRPDPDRANPNGLFAPRDLGTDPDGQPVLQDWARVPDLSPLGLQGKEVSDWEDVARGFLYGAGDGEIDASRGEANFIEWFFPQRLVLDILLAARLDTSHLSPAILDALTERGGNPLTVIHNREVNVPVLGISADQGIFAGETRPLPTVFAFFPYQRSISSTRFCATEVNEYAHNDILWSREPRVPDLIIAFMNGGCPR